MFISYDRGSARLAVGSNSTQVKVLEFVQGDGERADFARVGSVYSFCDHSQRILDLHQRTC